MTLQQLEYLLAVNEYRHFGRAAEACNVTQPTLSAMIQKLEEELGVKLFVRSSQPVYPTTLGEKIIKKAYSIIKQSQEIKELVIEENHTISGGLHLGVLPTIAPYLLPRFYPQFQAKYPALDLRVYELKVEKIEEQLLQGDLDIAIIATHPESKRLEVHSLFYEEFYVYLAVSDPLFKEEFIRTSEIKGDHLWLLDEGHCFRDQLVKFCNIKGVESSRQSYNLGSIETFMRMVEGGKGLTLIPELSLLQLTAYQKELVRPFAIPRPARQIRLVTGKDFIRQSLLYKLQEAIVSSVPSTMHELKNTQYLV